MKPKGLTSMDDEKNSQEWDQIKSWVGTQQKDTRHPVEKLIEREHVHDSKVPGMATGGMVPDDMRQWLEPQGAGMIAPSAMPAPVVPAQAPIVSAAPVDQPVMPPEQAPMAPAGPSATPPVDFNAQADKIMGSSPESRQAQFEATQAPRAVNLLTSLGAGLGDSIARSYGRDSGAHHQETLSNAIQAKNAALLENQKNQAGMGKERFGIEQTLEAKDPASPLSQSVQKSFGPLLTRIGFHPQDVAKMSAANISDLTGKSVDVLKAEAESSMAAASLGLRAEEANSNMAHQRAEENNASAGRRMEAAKTLQGRGPLDKIYGLIPGTTSHDVKKTLEQEMSGGGGNEVERQTKDGKTAIFDAATKQFLRYK